MSAGCILQNGGKSFSDAKPYRKELLLWLNVTSVAEKVRSRAPSVREVEKVTVENAMETGWRMMVTLLARHVWVQAEVNAFSVRGPERLIARHVR